MTDARGAYRRRMTGPTSSLSSRGHAHQGKLPARGPALRRKDVASPARRIFHYATNITAFAGLAAHDDA